MGVCYWGLDWRCSNLDLLSVRLAEYELGLAWDGMGLDGMDIIGFSQGLGCFGIAPALRYFVIRLSCPLLTYGIGDYTSFSSSIHITRCLMFLTLLFIVLVALIGFLMGSLRYLPLRCAFVSF